MNEQNGVTAETDEHGKVKSVSFDDYSKQVQARQGAEERARRFEGELSELRKKLDAFSGIDIDALKADSEALKSVKREKAAGNQDEIEKLINAEVAKVQEGAAGKLKEMESKIQKLLGENKELKIVDRAMSAISGRFNEDMQDFIKQRVRESVDLDDSGNFVIKGEDGTVRYNQEHLPMKLDDFAGELAERFPSAVRPNQASGGKQAGKKFSSSGSSNGVSLDRYKQMTPQERAKLDPKEARALRKANLSSVSASDFLTSMRK